VPRTVRGPELIRERAEPAEVWHIITCEYPPDIGGVSDYTRAIASGLRATGREIHVWAPGRDRTSQSDGVAVHRTFGRLGPADLARVGAALNRFARPRRLLVQWVPHGYGYRSLNLPLAFWLAYRAFVGRDRIDLVIHEPFLAWSRRPAILAAAAIHRLMLWMAAAGSRRIWVTIPAWADAARHVLRPQRIGWLPVPSSVPVANTESAAARLRIEVAPDGAQVIGHFSGYSPSVRGLLEPTLHRILDDNPTVRVVLIGKGSVEFSQALRRARGTETRVQATGVLDSQLLSTYLQACDVMLQPYPDGVSSRRTTAVALLAHGRAIVTNRGHLTDGVWSGTPAVRMVDAPTPTALAAAVASLLADEAERSTLGNRAKALYADVFDVRHTIATLLDASSDERRLAPSIAR